MTDVNAISWLEVLKEIKSLLEADSEIDLTNDITWLGQTVDVRSRVVRFKYAPKNEYVSLDAVLHSQNMEIISEGHIAHRPALLVWLPDVEKPLKKYFGRLGLFLGLFNLDEADLKKVRFELILPVIDPTRVRKVKPKSHRGLYVKIPTELYNKTVAQAAAQGVSLDDYVTKAFEEYLEQMEHGKE